MPSSTTPTVWDIVVPGGRRRGSPNRACRGLGVHGKHPTSTSDFRSAVGVVGVNEIKCRMQNEGAVKKVSEKSEDYVSKNGDIVFFFVV